MEESKGWGCLAYIPYPENDGTMSPVYLRVPWEEFEPIGAKAIWLQAKE